MKSAPKRKSSTSKISYQGSGNTQFSSNHPYMGGKVQSTGNRGNAQRGMDMTPGGSAKKSIAKGGSGGG